MDAVITRQAVIKKHIKFLFPGFAPRLVILDPAFTFHPTFPIARFIRASTGFSISARITLASVSSGLAVTSSFLIAASPMILKKPSPAILRASFT
jgi:hypothetical protein